MSRNTVQEELNSSACSYTRKKEYKYNYSSD